LTPRSGRASWALAFVLLSIFSHAPLFVAGYVQDDHLAIESNPVVARGSLGEIFTSSYWKGAEGDDRSLYRPVTVASYAWERAITGGARPDTSHAINVALHTVVALLLLLLAIRIGSGRRAAIAAGMLFVVLPAPTEAVANVVGRAELLAALFSLAALLVLSHAGDWDEEGGPARKQRLAAWGAGLLVFAGLCSKETAVVALLLMLVLELLFRPKPAGLSMRWWIDRAAALAPSALAAVVYVVLRTRALEAFPATQKIPSMDNPLVLLPGAGRLATALSLLPRYLALLVVPRSLANDYSGPTIPTFSGIVAPGPLLGLGLLLSLVLLVLAPALPGFHGKTHGARVASFSAALFLFPYLVTGNLLFPVGAIFAERFLYLPAAGFCLAIGCLFGAAVEHERWARLATIALGAVLAIYGVRTLVRCLDWRDDLIIFTAAARVNPTSPRAHFAAGKETSKRVHDPKADRVLADESLRWYEDATRLWTEYPIAWYEKGALLGQIGELPRAESALEEALRLSPGYASAHYNLAIALHRQRRFEEAERSARKAVLWDPESARAWAELGHLRFETGRRAEASEAYRHAVALGRTDLLPRVEGTQRP
jgi:tetratricopeptide (TPR) repeat protein